MLDVRRRPTGTDWQFSCSNNCYCHAIRYDDEDWWWRQLVDVTTGRDWCDELQSNVSSIIIIIIIIIIIWAAAQFSSAPLKLSSLQTTSWLTLHRPASSQAQELYHGFVGFNQLYSSKRISLASLKRRKHTQESRKQTCTVHKQQARFVWIFGDRRNYCRCCKGNYLPLP